MPMPINLVRCASEESCSFANAGCGEHGRLMPLCITFIISFALTAHVLPPLALAPSLSLSLYRPLALSLTNSTHTHTLHTGLTTCC